ncbi:bcl-2-like protein 1 isoform X2 [Eurytemora carolleeae]|uniref:bcl-2-like protein 1 isoform X2 n=1 Tax=Eurytemora carolleeae TaxID=1294199 RepID=UPI000C783B6B|nr:bcl-2-like protein 1 isoform X2 [Eurytemora carolleeae]|eukprot:XP_023344648.1 bcl-2-like protein 1 isoform X2 [Eurytemora affinis]
MDNMRTPRDGENSETFLCRVREFFHPTPSEIRIKQETRELVDFAVYFSLRTNFSGSSTRTESCLRRCISRMHEKHSMVFGGMMTRLNINRNIDFYQGFIEVSEELFREEISWSKIVALYAFGARLAQFCAENDMEDLLRDISESLARFSDEHLAAYILAQGGWETLCDEYPPEDELETRVWKSLGILALCLTSASVFLVLRR